MGSVKMQKALIFSVLLVSVVVYLAPVRSLDLPLNDDVLGLIVLKADLQDPEQKLASWNEDDYSPCSWNGVKCHPRTNRVTELILDGFSLSGRIGRGLLQLQFLHKLSLSNNNLTGIINPNLLLRLNYLKVVDLSNNKLSGSISDGFFRQCGWLRDFSLANNKLTGKIPVSISSCLSLAALNLSSNRFSGSMPLGIWSLSSLRSLDLSRNELEGVFPEKIEKLNNLLALDLSRNRFSGPIPSEIGSFMLLKSIDLSDNSLSGNLPESFQKLTLCYYLNLRKNLLEGEVPKWIGKMKSLETLDLSMNKFSGQVPDSIGNLLALKYLNFSANRLIGSLPDSIANCVNLLALDFSGNSMTGKLPSWLFQDASHEVSSLKNDISTESIKKIQVLDFSSNSFSDEIGAGLGNLKDLQRLNLSGNSLTGLITSTIGDLKHLCVLDLSHNQLSGTVPREIGRAVSLEELRLENNNIEGNIPSSIKNCSSLRSLILSHNKLVGSIPREFAKLTNLEEVDLSFNELTGMLPKQLANLGYLHTFNISHNHISGDLPAGGFFNTISPNSVFGNSGICGSIVNKSCPAIAPKPIVLNPNETLDPFSGKIEPPGSNHKRILLSISSLIAISAASAIVVGVIAITVLNLRVRASTVSRTAEPVTFSGGYDFSRSPTTDSNSGKLVMFSGEPDFSTGTHALLNKDCELGRGGFGAVYRTVIRDEYPVAIKKLTVSSLVKSQDEFEREVKKLGKLKHSNLVKLEGYYWTTSLQLLIYEFLSNGSLYKHLHEPPGGSSSSLSWNDRFNIILGIAKSLAYLHKSNIIHYNIKSSNVLLDSSGEAKVGDYGLARLLPMLDRYVLSSKIQCALGYMAPEFACRTVKITEKCDVYGFGVLVLEVVTGKKPVEYMEDDVVVLCDMVREALEDGRVEECIDPRLQGKFLVEEVVAVIKLGLICTTQVPSSRPQMGEAVNILKMIRCSSESSDELSSS